METVPTTVRIDEQCAASELRGGSRDRAKQSLEFFLSSVLGLRLTPELAAALTALQKGRLLLEVAEGTALWYQLRGIKLKAKPIDHEAVSWLFPEVKEL